MPRYPTIRCRLLSIADDPARVANRVAFWLHKYQADPADIDRWRTESGRARTAAGVIDLARQWIVVDDHPEQVRADRQAAEQQQARDIATEAQRRADIAARRERERRDAAAAGRRRLETIQQIRASGYRGPILGPDGTPV